MDFSKLDHENSTFQEFLYMFMFMTLTWIIPLVVMVFCYTSIIVLINKRAKQNVAVESAFTDNPGSIFL